MRGPRPTGDRFDPQVVGPRCEPANCVCCPHGRDENQSRAARSCRSLAPAAAAPSGLGPVATTAAVEGGNYFFPSGMQALWA